MEWRKKKKKKKKKKTNVLFSSFDFCTECRKVVKCNYSSKKKKLKKDLCYKHVHNIKTTRLMADLNNMEIKYLF